MADLSQKYRDDGVGGIHSADVQRAIDNGDLERGSDGFLHDEDGKSYNDEGKPV